MKYITIDADYLSSGVKDSNGNQLSNEDLKLPKNIWNEIQKWVQDYSQIIQLDDNERKNEVELIRRLDNCGIDLCQKVLTHFNGKIKIEYYSEGFLKKIPIK